LPLTCCRVDETSLALGAGERGRGPRVNSVAVGASLAGRTKVAGQSGQGQGGRLAWSRRCCRRLDDWGRTPEWVRLWRDRLARDEKVFPQSEHWKGRSPVCVRRWLRRCICFLKVLVHTEHLKCRSETWAVWRCLTRRSREGKWWLFWSWHSVHTCGAALLCETSYRTERGMT
uniref:Uncharacterized protein n=1 Tax=Oncorhynchus tshawytscha TaxID=74940 RepID=A0AAZ3QL12_ONCTS